MWQRRANDMKFSTREDIDAPADFVFEAVSDFAAFERQALRRGADVRRVDQGQVVVGSAWDIAFQYRGKDRRMRATVATLDAPQVLGVETAAAGIDGITKVEVVALSPKKTRVAVSIDLSAKTLSARLLLQSFKLAKSALTKRFKTRIAEQTQAIEERHRRYS